MTSLFQKFVCGRLHNETEWQDADNDDREKQPEPPIEKRKMLVPITNQFTPQPQPQHQIILNKHYAMVVQAIIPSSPSKKE